MNTKVLASLLVIGAIMAISGAGTWAYFSDEETSVGNTFTSGVIDIELSPGNSQVVTAQAGDGCNPETTDRLKPCYVGTLTYTVKNAGDNNADIYMALKNVVNSDLGQSEPESVADPGMLHTKDISQKIWIDLSINGEQVLNDGVITLDQIKNLYIKVGDAVPPDAVVIVTISFHLDKNAGNAYQSDVSTFDVEMLALQLGGATVPGDIYTLPP